MPDQLETSVVRLKVMDALRAESPEQITHIAALYNLSTVPDILSLAVQISNINVVHKVVELYVKMNRSINEQDNNGDTPLHKAVHNKQEEVIKFLMSLPYINDTILNKDGLAAADMAPDPETKDLMARLQNDFAQKTAVQLRFAFQSQDTETLWEIFANPRVPEFIDINGLDPDTGLTVLHASAASGNEKLVELILANGGNPLAKDGQGRLAVTLTKNENIKRLLNNAAKSRAILVESIQGQDPSGPPKMSGYLSKWTNFTTGYKVRWFSLENNKLSYSKSPKDSVRGTVSLRNARVKVHSSENRRFEVKTPTTKFHLRANTPVEANQWVWSLQNAITYVKDREKKSRSNVARSASQASSKAPPSKVSISSSSVTAAAASAGSPTSSNFLDAHFNPGPRASNPNLSHVRAPSTVSVSPSVQSTSAPIGKVATGVSVLSDDASKNNNSYFVNDLGMDTHDDEYDETSEEDDVDWHTMKPAPVTVESMQAQLFAVKDLLGLLVLKTDEPEIRDAITQSVGNIDVMSTDLQRFSSYMMQEIHRLRGYLDRSENAQRMWAKQVRDLEVKVGSLEDKLYSQKGGPAGEADEEDDDDVFYDTVDEWQQQTKEPVSEQQELPATHRSDIDARPSAAEISETLPQVKEAHRESNPSINVSDTSSPNSATIATAAATTAAVVGTAGLAEHETVSHQHEAVSNEHEEPAPTVTETGEQADPSEEAPAVEDSHEHSGLTEKQKEISDMIADDNTFAGYDDAPRAKLSIDDDKRPRISLWGILKNLIGKDMTRMTLPVTFNECTNLLQRSAEDMEYVDLLDKAAAAVDDPGLRMAYIAAFGASSYSSTINRVAKPFNPLLGETFEYARPDMGYRLFAEQVSHHPPIGAVIAQSARWDFYGESNVKSKFNGRSFDINPLGLWYLNLRPDKGAGVEEELYSFRKITSSVVGIMIGNPVVDNYGDMVITNHTTGVTCTVHFKARGWRGASAYKLEGVVESKDGEELYSIGGTWNDKIYATKANTKGRLLLWQVHDRPSAPFNLTPFAITLNALPKPLESWLAPTDTRLRPDQRAMEEGRYDDASDDKFRVEEKQRAARREREQSGTPYSPRWFELTKHPITGKDYYKPTVNYWKLRSEHELADKGDIF